MEIITKTNELQTQGLSETTGFAIKASPAAFQILSSGLYTKKVRAVLREIGCNAVDAHVLNGNQEKPIDVKIPNRLDNQFYIRDYGPGLSHEQIMSLYTTYFDSTKQASNDLIGGFGVGSKSPFAYTDSFTVMSRHNGVQRTYIAYTNDEGHPAISLAGEIDTDEPSGLQVGFPVKPEDLREFQLEAESVYSSFKVTPNILGVTLNIQKPVELTKSISLQNNTWGDINVNMGGVQYPLMSFNQEQLDKMNLTPLAHTLLKKNIVLHVPIGSLSVAASREALQYDKKTLGNIPSILENAANEIRTLLLEKFNECDKSKSSVALANEFTSKYEHEKFYNFIFNVPFEDPVIKNNDSLKQTLSIIKDKQYIANTSLEKDAHYFTLSRHFFSWMKERSRTYDIDDYTERKGWQAQNSRLWTRTLSSAVMNNRERNDLFASSNRNTFVEPLNPKMKDLEIPVNDTVFIRLPYTVGSDKLLDIYNLVTNELKLDIYKSNNIVFGALPAGTLDAAAITKYNASCDKLVKEYDWKEKSYNALKPLLKPSNKVAAAKRTKEDWFVLPMSNNFKSYHTYDTVKKALRTYVHGGYKHNNTLEQKAYVYQTFDRTADRNNISIKDTELFKAVEKYQEFTDKSLEILKESGHPYDMIFIDKKDEKKFLKEFPESITLEELKDTIQNDPVLIAKEQTWIKERPTIKLFDYQVHNFLRNVQRKDILQELDNSSFFKTKITEWQSYVSGRDNTRSDNEYVAAFNTLLNRKHEPLKDIDATHEFHKVMETYPYLKYLIEGAPKSILKDYIEEKEEQLNLKVDNYTEPLF